MRACVTTSRPVVGSSITTRRGLADERGGDRHALLLAAGELVREAARERPARPGGRRCPSAREHALVVAASRARAPQHVGRARRRSAAPGSAPRPGFCGTNETTRPRSARTALSPRPVSAWPSTRDGAVRDPTARRARSRAARAPSSSCPSPTRRRGPRISPAPRRRARRPRRSRTPPVSSTRRPSTRTASAGRRLRAHAVAPPRDGRDALRPRDRVADEVHRRS